MAIKNCLKAGLAMCVRVLVVAIIASGANTGNHCCHTHLPAGAVARLVLAEQKANTLVREHTLLHRETLLVVAAGDAEDIALHARNHD
jgi:hypothetical protein